jgi:hypothetical protein
VGKAEVETAGAQKAKVRKAEVEEVGEGRAVQQAQELDANPLYIVRYVV